MKFRELLFETICVKKKELELLESQKKLLSYTIKLLETAFNEDVSKMTESNKLEMMETLKDILNI